MGPCFLNDNLLTGTLPPEFGQMTGLMELGFSKNDLAGSIPDEWCGWGQAYIARHILFCIHQPTSIEPNLLCRFKRIDPHVCQS
jgi:hypothetical protein